MSEEIKKETPVENEKPVEEKPAEQKKEEKPAAEEQPTTSAQPNVEANELVEENAKLKAFRNETVLKQNGFKPEFNGWIQAIIEKDGKSFDNAEELATYLKDKKFDVFKSRTMVDTANVQPEKTQEENAQGKKPKTQEEIDTTYIYVPGLDKENNK